MSILEKYHRVTRSRPCPICEHTDWCLISKDQPPSSAVCCRVESKHRWRDAGWFHRLRDDPQPRRARSFVRSVPVRTRRFDNLFRSFEKAAATGAVTQLSGQLGVSARSLERLRVGRTRGLWAFPMTNPYVPGVVCGIRYRAPTGKKFSEPGSAEGLFIPDGLAFKTPLLLPEGPTDTAAALDLGFEAVGRPNCCNGLSLIKLLVARERPPMVVVVADKDSAGQDGAASTARAVLSMCKDVRVVTPPVKDLRDWLKQGARAINIHELIETAAPLRLSYRGAING